MNSLAGIKKTLQRIFRRMNGDAFYYQKIIELVPELQKYSEWQIDFVRETAAKKNCGSVQGYYKLLEADPEELTHFRQNLTYVGSHFFRGDDWPFLSERCLSSFAGADRVRVWCAACSSGQEVYSIIAALSDFVPLEKIDVFASDYNEEMIRKCEEGSHFNMHLKEVPEKYRGLLSEGPKKFTFTENVRKRITTGRIDLLKDEYPRGFDIVLCRNVLKFFTPEVMEDCQKKLSASLCRGGYLFLSDDDGGTRVELIKDSEKLGLVQLDNRCIYQKL